ncbi:hypothetical protein RDWZM_003150 [Blomia tropicalis]|uniref:Uncharacterized protein n=1 Tax=Blomia tropicalis TaxID=40697 RepID=A0A9Q0RSE5_BLOTA|nr:hypothetical protein RDWZM_003150 [Blomia tropicalis]
MAIVETFICQPLKMVSCSMPSPLHGHGQSMRGTMSSTDRWVMKINRLFMNAIGAHRSNTKNRLKNNAIELTVGLDMSLSRSMYSSCG